MCMCHTYMFHSCWTLKIISISWLLYSATIYMGLLISLPHTNLISYRHTLTGQIARFYSSFIFNNFRTSIVFSIWYIFMFLPTISSISLPAHLVRLFDNNYSLNQSEVTSPCDFDSHLLMVSNGRICFSYICWPFVYVLLRNVHLNPLSIFNEVISF